MEKGFRIISWNINGLRSVKRPIKDILDDLNADILCLQETKINRENLEENLALVDGYYSFFSFSKYKFGYSGVATYCRKEACPISATDTLIVSNETDPEMVETKSILNNLGLDLKQLKLLDCEGRCVITKHSLRKDIGSLNLYVINVYCPRADPEKPDRKEFKCRFYKILREVASKLSAEENCSVVVAGDLNTYYKPIDTCEPQEFEPDREDRLILSEFLTPNMDMTDSSDKFLLLDTFRYFHPDKKEAYTCWNTRTNARANNYGARIDYILCDMKLVPYIREAEIHPNFLGSDHCPVSVRISELSFWNSGFVPSLSTKFYPEFKGNQQKLDLYFKPYEKSKKFSEFSNKKLDSNENQSEVSSSIKKEVVNKILNFNTKQTDSKKFIQGKNKKRKLVASKIESQKSINSFFLKNSRDINFSSYEDKNDLPEICENDLDCDDKKEIDQNCQISKIRDNQVSLETEKFRENSQKCSNSKEIQNSQEKSQNNSWNFLMKNRNASTAPLCSGHKEPCALRTVKKSGPNFNKRFYACAKAAGPKNNVETQCEFFKWFSCQFMQKISDE